MAIRRFNGSGVANTSKSSKVWDQYTVLNDFQSIATVIVPSAGAATIDFTNIPQNYTHLQLRCFLQDDRTTYGLDQLRVQVGSGGTLDTGSTSYAYHYLRGDGAATSAYGGPTSAGANGSWEINGAVGTNVSPTSWGSTIIDIADYTNTSKNKTMKSLSGNDLNGTGPSTVPGRVAFGSCVWLGTNALQAINTIRLYPENASKFLEHSKVALYAIKVAS